MTKAELEAGLAAVAAGDPNALAELYRAYYQPVFLLAASLTGDTALAEDTVQEVFLTVQTCAGRYRPAQVCTVRNTSCTVSSASAVSPVRDAASRKTG